MTNHGKHYALRTAAATTSDAQPDARKTTTNAGSDDRCQRCRNRDRLSGQAAT